MRSADTRKKVVVLQVNRGESQERKGILGSENSMSNGPEEAFQFSQVFGVTGGQDNK